MAQQVYASPPIEAPTPVTPEQRCIPNHERMQEDADLARLLSGGTIPLTPLAQGAGTATADAGCIDHAQAPIGALFDAPEESAYSLLGTEASHQVGAESLSQ